MQNVFAKIRLVTWSSALALLIAPLSARAQVAVLSSTVEETTAAAGTRYSGSIVVSNPSGEAQTVRFYKTDYTFSCDGTTNFADAGTLPRSNAAWVSLQSERVVIPARSQMTIPYGVAVPANADMRGTYWSTIMVEGVTAAPVSPDGKALAVGAVMRYAIQVATHIQSTGSRTVHFDTPVLSRSADSVAVMNVDVRDDGERAYRPSLWIEVYDTNGALKAKVKQQRGLLYPGTSLRQRFELGKLPAGSYKAIVYADTGDDAIFAAQYTINY